MRHFELFSNIVIHTSIGQTWFFWEINIFRIIIAHIFPQISCQHHIWIRFQIGTNFIIAIQILNFLGIGNETGSVRGPTGPRIVAVKPRSFMLHYLVILPVICRTMHSGISGTVYRGRAVHVQVEVEALEFSVHESPGRTSFGLGKRNVQFGSG